MRRSRVAALVVSVATLQLHSSAANQALDAFRVSKSNIADTHQETLEAIHAESKRATEVFPGAYVSPFGALVMKRIEDLFARVGEADRATLLADNVGAGFDRSIISWGAEPTGRTVLAVRYYRDRLSKHLGMELSDDYGRPEPLDVAEYEFVTIAVCSRAAGVPATRSLRGGGEAASGWTCGEDQLAAVAKKHNLALPNDREGRAAVAKKLVELVLRQQ